VALCQGGREVSLYMIQARLTPEAWQAIYSSSVDRREVISSMLEKAGGKLVDYYFSFGDSDVMLIADAPDNRLAGAAAIAIARSGAVTEIRTTPLLSYEEGVEAMRRSADMGYTPPR